MVGVPPLACSVPGGGCPGIYKGKVFPYSLLITSKRRASRDCDAGPHATRMTENQVGGGLEIDIEFRDCM